jgi:hypothetical protein
VSALLLLPASWLLSLFAFILPHLTTTEKKKRQRRDNITIKLYNFDMINVILKHIVVDKT